VQRQRLFPFPRFLSRTSLFPPTPPPFLSCLIVCLRATLTFLFVIYNLISIESPNQFYCASSFCTDDSQNGPQAVSRATFYRHRATEKRRRVRYGSPGGGPAIAEGPSGGRSARAAAEFPVYASVSADIGAQGNDGAAASTPPGADVRDTLRSGGTSSDSGSAHAQRRCDAEDTPDECDASRHVSTDLESNESNNGEAPEFIDVSGSSDAVRTTAFASLQSDVNMNEIRLRIDQFKEHKADLGLYGYTVQHDLTQESIADLLKLSSETIKYRTPYLLWRFIDESVKLGTRHIDCCVHG